MFKQVKSALFWYYLYKFRKRVLVISSLLIIALFANFIYSDVVEYLSLKNKLEYLELALVSKWLIILFNILFSIYLILTLFKKEKQKDEIKDTNNNKEEPIIKNNDKFTKREKEFLYKKLNSKADRLVNK